MLLATVSRAANSRIQLVYRRVYSLRILRLSPFPRPLRLKSDIAEKRLQNKQAQLTLSQHVSSPPTLRPYQQEAIDACLSALRRGLRRIGVSSPTGSGKTTMFMSLLPLIRGRRQALILVGSVELALQAEAAAKTILPGYTVEVEQAKRIASGKADVTIATYQTLNNAERLQKFDPGDFKVVIVDEAHHAAALSYLRLLHYFNDQVELPQSTGPFSHFDHGNRVPIIGFSATFTRHDQLALSAAFEEIVFHRDVGSMLEEGWLSPVRSTAVYATLHLDDVEVTQKGDYNSISLASHVNTKETNSLIARTWLRQAAERRSTLVFAVNLKHVAALVRTFRSAGVDARSISAHTDPKERKDTIAKFAAGQFPVLVNCEVLTEGTDIKEIDCIILARPTKSKNLLAQMVGRGLRLSPETGKKDCYLLDIADNISRASGIKVAPTLFGLSYEDGAQPERPVSMEDIPSGLSGPEPSVGTINTVTLVDCEDPFGLDAEEAIDKPVLAKISRNSWVGCGNNRFILELMGPGFITVSQEGNQPWSVSFTQKLPSELFRGPAEKRPRAPYRARLQIAYGDTLQRAIETADKYAERQLGHTGSKALYRDAAWRSRPASRKQVDMLMKLKGMEVERDDQQISIMGRSMPVENLTAGQVAAYLTAAQHGALAARRKRDAVAARALAKEAKRREKDAEMAKRNLPLPNSLHSSL